MAQDKYQAIVSAFSAAGISPANWEEVSGVSKSTGKAWAGLEIDVKPNRAIFVPAGMTRPVLMRLAAAALEIALDPLTPSGDEASATTSRRRTVSPTGTVAQPPSNGKVGARV